MEIFFSIFFSRLPPLLLLSLSFFSSSRSSVCEILHCDKSSGLPTCISFSLSSYSQFYISILSLHFLFNSLDLLRSHLEAMANAASGIAVHDDCKLKFLELKAKRTFRFIVFKIEEVQKQVIVEKLGEPAQSYDDFAASLPADECRYAVFDYDFVTAENCQKSRIFFIAWSPDTARVRSKMIYASSKDRFKRELDGIQVELQATDPTEMGLDVFQSRTNQI